MTEDGWYSQEQKDTFLGGFFKKDRLDNYDFKYMRILLVEYGISAPESDDELGYSWGSYLRKLEKRIKEVEDEHFN